MSMKPALVIRAISSEVTRGGSTDRSDCAARTRF
jgi:hypothetical protein